MPTIDELTTRTHTNLLDTDITYVGVPNDADPDQKTTIQDLKRVLGRQAFVLDVTRGETVDANVGSDAYAFVMPFDFTITDVVASVATAPTGADLLVDVRAGASSVLDGVVTIDDGGSSSRSSVSPVVVSDGVVSSGDVVSVDVDQVGSSVAGAGLKVVLVGFVG